MESDLREALQCWESSERPFARSILCGTDPSCEQTNHPLNVSTMVRQATWQGSVQVPWSASHMSHLLGRKTSLALFVMLVLRQDTKLSQSQLISF